MWYNNWNKYYIGITNCNFQKNITSNHTHLKKENHKLGNIEDNFEILEHWNHNKNKIEKIWNIPYA